MAARDKPGSAWSTAALSKHSRWPLVHVFGLDPALSPEQLGAEVWVERAPQDLLVSVSTLVLESFLQQIVSVSRREESFLLQLLYT